MARNHNTKTALFEGHLLYQKGKTQEALDSYRKVAFKKCLKNSYEVWMAIGRCLFKLKKYNLSRKAFDKALTFENCSSEVIINKIILTMLSIDKCESLNPTFKHQIEIECEKIKLIVTLLKRGLELSPKNAILHYFASDLYFYKRDYLKSEFHAKKALENSKTKISKSLAYYMIAKIFHSNGNLKEAYKAYKAAVKYNESNTPAVFGHSQLCIYFTRNLQNAFESLERISNKFAQFVSVKKLLGFSHARKSLDKKAKELFEKSLSQCKKDLDTTLMLAQTCENHSKSKSTKLYEAAIELMKKSNIRIPFSVYNNLAVLYHEDKNFEKANSIYQRILEEIGDSRAIEKIVKYNLGCLFRDEGNLKKSLELFESLLKDSPDEIDVKLNIAILSNKLSKDKTKLIECLEEILKEEFSAKGFIFLANKIKEKNFKKAKTCFEKILAKTPNHSYSMIALANFAIDSNKKEHYNGIYKTHIRKALVKDGNVFGINSLGVMLAKKGLIEEAKTMFLKAKEGFPKCAVFCENIGHCFMIQKSYANAIVHYEQALEKYTSKSKPKTALIKLCLANAYYYRENKADAKKLLEQLIEDFPEMDKAHYNLAFVLEEEVKDVVEISGSAKTLVLLKSAKETLLKAQKIYEKLKGSETERIKHAAESGSTRCEEKTKDIELLLNVLEKDEKAKKEEVEKKEREYLLMKEKRLEDLKKEEIEQTQKLKEKNEKAIESATRLKDIKEKWDLIERSIRESKKKKKKPSTQSRFIEDEEIDEEEKERLKRVKKFKELENEPNMFENYIEKHSDDDQEYVPVKDLSGSENELELANQKEKLNQDSTTYINIPQATNKKDERLSTDDMNSTLKENVENIIELNRNNLMKFSRKHLYKELKKRNFTWTFINNSKAQIKGYIKKAISHLNK